MIVTSNKEFPRDSSHVGISRGYAGLFRVNDKDTFNKISDILGGEHIWSLPFYGSKTPIKGVAINPSDLPEKLETLLDEEVPNWTDYMMIHGQTQIVLQYFLIISEET